MLGLRSTAGRSASARELLSLPSSLRVASFAWIVPQPSTLSLRADRTGSRLCGRSSVPDALIRSYSTILESTSHKTYFQDPPHKQQYSQPPPPPPPPKPSRLGRAFRTLLLLVIFFPAGFYIGSAPAFDVLKQLRMQPTDEETLTLFKPDAATDPQTAEINEKILSHPLVEELRRDKSLVESRPHLKIPAKLRQYNLTGGTLSGPDKISVPPLVFSSKDGSHFYSFQHLGPNLCGHPTIIHGGLLATLVDEGLARCCFPALPNKVGVTASLTINYRNPCPANSYVVLKAETTKVEGRKAWVKGRLEILPSAEEWEQGVKDGKVAVEADALFIEPRNTAGMMKIAVGAGPEGVPKTKAEQTPEEKGSNGSVMSNGSGPEPVQPSA